MKSKTFRTILIVFAVVFAVGALVSVGAQAKKPPVVGISTGSSGTSWRNIMIDALNSVGQEYKAAGTIADYKLVNNVTNGDATEQANIIRDFTSQGVDIILLNPNSPDALNGVIKEAQDAGILVMAFDATVTAPDVVNVTLDHYAWNKKNVEFIASTLKSGNAIQIYGLDGHPANNERIRATADVLKAYPGIKLIANTTGYWDQTKAKEVATQIIGSGQRIDAVITQDGEAYGVLSAFLDANKLPKVMFGDPGTAFFKEWKKLRDKEARLQGLRPAQPPRDRRDRFPHGASALQREAVQARRPEGQHLLLQGGDVHHGQELQRGLAASQGQARRLPPQRGHGAGQGRGFVPVGLAHGECDILYRVSGGSCLPPEPVSYTGHNQ